LSGNNVTNSVEGIWLDSSSGNTLSGNNVTANNVDGIYLSSSSNNTIYHNNFNNTNQIYSYDSTNVWDNRSMGNYWSDYLTKYPNATQVDSSGVWNTPYVIDANNTDRYPLTHPYVIAASPTFPILPLSVVATVLAVIVLLAVIIYKKKGRENKRALHKKATTNK
jgi:parallel beta-helix repeat protein